MSATVDNDLEEYPDDKIIRKEKDVETVSHSNKLDDEYLDYLNNIDSSYLSGMSYSRYTRMNMLVKNGNTVELFDYNLSPLPETKDGKVDSLMIDNYDLLAGKMAEDSNDIMLIVDSYNKISSNLYDLLGLTDNSNFDSLIGKEIKLVNNNEYYTEFNNIFISNTDYDAMYDNDQNFTLKITGISRGKKDNQFSQMAGSGLSYKGDLINNYIAKNKESKVVKVQENVDYNVLSGQKFDESVNKELILSLLGGNDIPYKILIVKTKLLNI